MSTYRSKHCYSIVFVVALCAALLFSSHALAATVELEGQRFECLYFVAEDGEKIFISDPEKRPFVEFISSRKCRWEEGADTTYTVVDNTVLLTELGLFPVYTFTCEGEHLRLSGFGLMEEMAEEKRDEWFYRVGSDMYSRLCGVSNETLNQINQDLPAGSEALCTHENVQLITTGEIEYEMIPGDYVYHRMILKQVYCQDCHENIPWDDAEPQNDVHVYTGDGVCNECGYRLPESPGRMQSGDEGVFYVLQPGKKIYRQVDADGTSWYMTTSSDWIHTTPSSGSGSGEFYVSVDPNEGALRNGTVSFFFEGQDAILMHIVQLGVTPTEYYLSVDRGNVDGLLAEVTGGQGMNINVASNIAWSVKVTQGSEWITLSTTGGIGNGSFYTVTAPNTGAERYGMIEVSANGCETIKIKMVQKGAIQHPIPVVTGPSQAEVNKEFIYQVSAAGALRFYQYLNGQKTTNEFAAQDGKASIPLTYMGAGRFVLQFSAVYADGTESEKSERLLVFVKEEAVNPPVAPQVQLVTENTYVGEKVLFTLQGNPGAKILLYQNNALIPGFEQTIGNDGQNQVELLFRNQGRYAIQFSVVLDGIESPRSKGIVLFIQSSASRGDVERKATREPDGFAGMATASTQYSNAEKAFIQHLKDSCKPGAEQNYGFKNIAEAESYAIAYINAVKKLDVSGAYKDEYFIGMTSKQRAQYVNEKIRYYLLSDVGEDKYQVFNAFYGKANQQLDKNIIFFFDGCSNYCENGSQYTRSTDYNMASVCIVIRKDANNLPRIAYVTHEASTIPCHPTNPDYNGNDPMPTVRDGMYEIVTKNHHDDYASLKVVLTHDDYIRCSAKDAFEIGTDILPPVNIHTRLYYAGKITHNGTPNSQGCFNIAGIDRDFSKYNTFIEITTGKGNAVNTKFTSSELNKDQGLVIVDRKMNTDELVHLYGKEAAECLLRTTIKSSDIAADKNASSATSQKDIPQKQFDQNEVNESIVAPGHYSNVNTGEPLILRWNAIAGAEKYRIKLRNVSNDQLLFGNDNDGFIEVTNSKLQKDNDGKIKLDLTGYLKHQLQDNCEYNIYVQPVAEGYEVSSGTFARFFTITKDAVFKDLYPGTRFTAHTISTIYAGWEPNGVLEEHGINIDGYDVILKKPDKKGYKDYARAQISEKENEFTIKIDEWKRIDGKIGIEQNAENESYRLHIIPHLSSKGEAVDFSDEMVIELVIYAPGNTKKPVKVNADWNVDKLWGLWGEFDPSLEIKISWEYPKNEEQNIDGFWLFISKEGAKEGEYVIKQEIKDPALRSYVLPKDSLEGETEYKITVVAQKIITGAGYETVRRAESDIKRITTEKGSEKEKTNNQGQNQENANNTEMNAGWVSPVKYAVCSWGAGGPNYSWATKKDNSLDHEDTENENWHLAWDMNSEKDKGVYAAADGTVAKIGENTANGFYIILQHESVTIGGEEKTLYSFYAHLKKNSILIPEKDENGKPYYVAKDTMMAQIGNTGTSTSEYHLHFAIIDRLMLSGGYWGSAFYSKDSKDDHFYGEVKKREEKGGDAFYVEMDSLKYKGVTYYNPGLLIDFDGNNTASVENTNGSSKPSNKGNTNIDITQILREIGSLSASGEGDVGTVSDGKDKGDAGGTSYGLYQFAERSDTPKEFVGWLGENAGNNKEWESIYNSLLEAWNASGSAPYAIDSEFSKKWTNVAEEYPESFAEAQTIFAKSKYEKYINEINGAGYGVEGLDVYWSEKNKHPLAIHQMIWARAVQAAPNAIYIAEAYAYAKACDDGDYSKITAKGVIEGPTGSDIPGTSFYERWVFRVYWEASKYTAENYSSMSEQEKAKHPNLATVRDYNAYCVKWKNDGHKINIIRNSTNPNLEGKCLVYFHTSKGNIQVGVFNRLNPYGNASTNEYRKMLELLKAN